MERFIALKNQRNSKIPPVSEFISNLSGDANRIFFKVANSLHETKNINPTYSYISYQDIIDMSPLSIKNESNDNASNSFVDLTPCNSFRWLYLIFSLASRTISEDKELESAKVDYFYNSFYNFVINTSEISSNEEKIISSKKLKNKILFLSGLFCTTAKLIGHAKYVTDQIKSTAFLNKILSLLNTNFNQYIDQEINGIRTKIQEFSVPEIFIFCSPMPSNDISSCDLFFDVDIYLKYSISRFLLKLFNVFQITDQSIISSFKKYLFIYYDHYILHDISHKVLSTFYGGDEKKADQEYNMKALEDAGKIILDFSSKTNGFADIIQKGEINLSSALSTIYNIGKCNPESLSTFFQNNEPVGKSIEYLLCSKSNNNIYKVEAAKLLAEGKWHLSNFRDPLLLLISSPSGKLKKSVSNLLSYQANKIVPDLLAIFPSVPYCGSKSNTFFEFLTSILPTLSEPQRIFSTLLDTLKSETTNIYNIPNANLYSKILKCIKIHNSFFDQQVCQTCLDLDKSYSNKEINFNTIDKNSISFDANKVYVKLSQPVLIKSFKLNYVIKSLSQTPRCVLLTICNDEIKDMKDPSKINWKKIFDKDNENYLNFSCQQKMSKIKFYVPIYVTGFALHFEKFWINKDNSLFDYRCHNQKSESVFCPECGSSTALDFKVTLKSGVAFPYTNIKSKECCEEALQRSNKILEDAEKDFHSIISLRDKAESILSKSIRINDKKSQLSDLYNDQCVTIYKQMTISLQRYCEIRLACGKYTNKQMEFNYISHPFQNVIASNEHNKNNDVLSESVNHCFHCRFCFIRNCLNFFTDLQNQKKKAELSQEKKETESKPSLLKFVYDNFDISSILLNYIINDSLFAQFAINAMISFCQSIPELTQKINDIFVSSLPNVSPQLVRLVCEIEHINDKYRSYRFSSILPSLLAAASYMNSQSKFAILVLQPLVSTITNSPILIRSANLYKEFTIYNSWRKLINKSPSKLIIPSSIVSKKEVLTSMLFDCQSESIRTLIKDVLQCTSKLSDEHFKQVYDYAFGLLTDSILEDIQLSSRQYFDQILSLFKNDKIRRKLLLNGFFEKIVNLINKETEKMLKQEDDSFLYYDNNTGFPIFVLMQFIDLFLKPIINLRYVIYRKQSLVVNIITNYFKLRSIIFQRSKYLYDSLALMKDIIFRIMQENFVLLSKKSESESKKEKNNDENHYGFVRGGRVGRGGRGAIRGTRGGFGRGIGRGGLGRGGFGRGGALHHSIFVDYDESPTNSDDHDMDSDTYNESDSNIITPDNTNNNTENAEDNNNNNNDQDEDIIVPNPNGPRIMIEAAVDAISFCPDIVIKEISAIIFPPKKVESIPIIFKKWRNHEDFLPGQLSRDPIMSDQIGKTFRDIREKFAILLNLQESMSEDNFCELMVDNNIIAFDLPIISVYKHVWVPSRGQTPMEVYCRVTGLDGEATENMVNSLPSEEVEQQPPEEKYGFTTILCDCGGFSQLLKVLDSYGNTDNKQNHLTKESLSELVKLLETFALVKRNRVEMNKLNGTNSILQLMKKLIGFNDTKGSSNLIRRTSSANAVDMAMSVSAKAAKQAKTVTTKEIFRQSILIASSLMAEDPMCTTNPEDWVSFILSALQNNFFRRNDNLISPFLSLLPPTAARSRELMEQVLRYFVYQLADLATTTSEAAANNNNNKNETKFNIYENCKSLFMLNGFAEFVLVIPVNSLGNTIRDLILEEPFVVDAISLLYKLFPPNEKDGRLSKKWKESVDVLYLPSMLKILVGMCRCHSKTQELFLEEDSKFLKLLMELEAITSKANIGELTSDILHACEEEPSVSKSAIESIRQKKKDEAKKKAQAEKKQAISIAQNISPELQAQLAELTEQSFECCICHEGYEFLPNEILGVYTFVNSSQGSSSSSSGPSISCSNPKNSILQFLGNSISCLNSLNTNFVVAFNTATYFVCVHPSCHNRATAADDRRNHSVTFDANFSSNQALNNLIMSIMLMDNGPNGDRAPHYGSLNNEWESASLRNSERPCNSIFPLPSSTLPQGSYKKALLNYVENFNGGYSSSSKQGASFRSLTDFRSIFIDLRTHVALTSIGEKIPIQLGGGSFSSITALWPFLINAGHIILDMNVEQSQQQKQPTTREELERELSSRLSPLLYNKDQSISQVKKDGIADLLLLSIWIMSLEEWNEVKIELLKIILSLSSQPDESNKKISSDQQQAAQSNENADSKNTDVFERTRSIFLFYIIIDRMQTMVKKPSGNPVKKDGEGRIVIGPYNSSSKWIKDFTDKINDEPASFQTDWTDFGEELQDEILEASDLKTLLSYAQLPSNEFEKFINDCFIKS